MCIRDWNVGTRLPWLFGAPLLMLAGCGYSSYGQATPMTCVPYARSVTGLAISGDAWLWWRGAQSRYAETNKPAPGGVLVFRRTDRLPSGHLAVVSTVLSGRRVLVTQANWLPHRITSDQPVLDVSPGNDWTTVRVWWPPANSWGTTVYPTYGFILPSPAAPTPSSATPLAQSSQSVLRVGS
jgi:surface antigen